MKKALLLICTLLSGFAFGQIPATGKVEHFPFNNNLNGLMGNNLSALLPQYDFDRFGNANSALKVVKDSNCIVNNVVVGLPMGNANRSVCMWIKNLGAPNMIRSYFNYSHQTKCFAMTEETGSTNKVVSNYVLAATTITVADNSWHCLIATFDGTVASLYVDGVLGGTKNLSFSNDTNKIRIGRSPAFANGGTGILYPNFLIDELVIYNRALSVSEVTQVCSSPSTSIKEEIVTSIPVTIFPNPTNNLINIETEMNCIGYSLSDLTGKILVSETLQDQKTIKVDLPRGVYFLKLSSENTFTVKKVVVQ